MPVTEHCDPRCEEECRRCKRLSNKADIDLNGDFDATHWAHRFVSRVRENPGIATDEGTMTSWFASAIMTGYDVARRKSRA